MPAHPGRKPTYTPHPKLSPSQAQRLEAVLQVAAGRLTVSEAARRLGLSRLHFQSLRHRGLAALAQALAPQRVGRKPKPPKQRQLEAQLKVLHKQKAQAQARAMRLQRLLRVARETLQARCPSARTKRPVRSRSARPATKVPADESPAPQPPPPPAVLEEVAAMRGRGLPTALAAAALGRSPATLRRWRARLREGRPALQRRGPHRAWPPAAPEALLRVESLVRETRGLPGARALAHLVPGLSRRTCARLKQRVLTCLEAERRQACVRVRVSAPGLVRALDALHVVTPEGRAYLLAGGDGHVPHR
ncbi:MAG TPA: helix-turn-helix domain-containing protein, partial [Aggregicoccus sp.]|nr:helix-turn-helix domain-containing protein [Aggregicoccus sp.]